MLLIFDNIEYNQQVSYVTVIVIILN